MTTDTDHVAPIRALLDTRILPALEDLRACLAALPEDAVPVTARDRADAFGFTPGADLNAVWGELARLSTAAGECGDAARRWQHVRRAIADGDAHLQHAREVRASGGLW